MNEIISGLYNATQSVFQVFFSDEAYRPSSGVIKVIALSSLAVVGAFIYAKREARRNLDLSYRQLCVAPDVSQNHELRSINLATNLLSDPPIVSRNNQLSNLNLCNNNLRTAPNVSENSQLRDLNLAVNSLSNPPNLSHNHALEILDLTENQLTIPPDVSQNPELIELYLADNLLTVAPDVSQNPSLTVLFLANNRLTTLPDSILTLSRECTVNVERNRFTPDYMEAFQERLVAHRFQHPNQGPTVTFSIYEERIGDGDGAPVSLDQQLATWSDEFENAFPQSSNEQLWGSRPTIKRENQREYFEPLLALADAQMLADYLARLRGIADYRAGGQARENIILRVERMLQLACKNEHFRGNMLALIRGSLETCGDRVLTAFNDIEIESHFNNGKLSDEQFRNLAIRAQRYELLKEHAIEVCCRLQLGDQIETVLYYHIHLKDRLELPFTTEGMLYPGLAGVTPEMLEAAAEKILAIPDAELLANSRHWEERMKQRHAPEIERLNERYGDLVECAREYFGQTDLERKRELIQKNTLLGEILQRARDRRVPEHYQAVVDYIMAEKNQAVADLGIVKK